MQHTLQTSQKADLSKYNGKCVIKIMTKLVPNHSSTEYSLLFLAISCCENQCGKKVISFVQNVRQVCLVRFSTLGGRVLTDLLIDGRMD